MTYQGWDLQLTAYTARDSRANFFPVCIAHSIAGRGGAGTDMTVNTIRLMTPADAAAYHALRIRSVREHPEAFGRSPEEVDGVEA